LALHDRPGPAQDSVSEVLGAFESRLRWRYGAALWPVRGRAESSSLLRLVRGPLAGADSHGSPSSSEAGRQELNILLRPRLPA
jgi:hypothetical protein